MTVDQVVVAGVAATLTWTNLDQDGEPADPSGTVTVGVTRADGTTVLSAGTATTVGSTGVRTVALTPAQTADLDLLTATWTDAGDSSAHTTTIEVIGRHYFTIAEARASDPSIADSYSTDEIAAARADVVDELEWICGRSFVPRYTRATLDGRGDRELWLPTDDLRQSHDLRTVEAVTVDGTALTSGELAELVVAEDSIIHAADGDVWPHGVGNVVIAWTYGLDAPNRHLKRAALRRLRHLLHSDRSGIPDRATSFQAVEGGTFALDTASRYETGIPDVDAVYSRFSKRGGGGADGSSPAPVSRTLDLDPQWGSLFHGGRR